MFSAETEELIAEGWRLRRLNFDDTIYFDYPVQTRSISLTGRACSLQCKHCGGHYLEGMQPIEQVAAALPFRSALVSGGCTREGKVPFAKHLDRLHELKQQVRLNFHVGLVDDQEIAMLRGLADTVSFDFVGDRETISEVYGLQQGPEDYVRVYQALRETVPVMPHLTLGLRGGRWSGEEKALDLLAEAGLDGLTFLVFIPTPGTVYADRQPPALEEVVRFLAQARCRFPTIPLALGCMRPKGRYREALDAAAVALGLNRIVLPAPAARSLAAERGLNPQRGEECCAL